MLHKLGSFKDPLLDRQIQEIVTAINSLTMVHPETGTRYRISIGTDPETLSPALILTEVRR